MRHRLVIPETPLTKSLVAGICTYETAAIISGAVEWLPTLPTITALNHRHPVVGVAIVLGLALHFCTPAPI